MRIHDIKIYDKEELSKIMDELLNKKFIKTENNNTTTYRYLNTIDNQTGGTA